MDGMETARRLIAEEREKKTGFLDLGNLQLTDLPAGLFDLTNLRSLNWASGIWTNTVNTDNQPVTPERLMP